MTVALSVIGGFLAALVGVIVGAVLERRNARRAHTDNLLADALDDLVSAIALVAGADKSAMPRYGSATSRIALHGSPELVAAFEHFQHQAETLSQEGQRRLVQAVQASRLEFGRGPVSDEAVATLLFGDSARVGH